MMLRRAFSSWVIWSVMPSAPRVVRSGWDQLQSVSMTDVSNWEANAGETSDPKDVGCRGKWSRMSYV